MLPQGLVTFMTWLVLFIGASAVVITVAVFVGPILGEFVNGIMGWFR